MDFNLDRLRTFTVVARTGNLSAAAKELGATQPNLGRQMTALEKEVGLTLFVRHSRGLALTKHGEEFRTLCRDIVGQIAQKINILKENESSMSGCLRVISGPEILEMILERLPKFSKEFPDINVSFLSTTDISQLQMGDSDMALMVQQLNDPKFIQLPLGNMPLRICASPDYLTSYGIPKTVEDLKSHKLILYGGENADILNGQFPHDLIKNPKQFILVTNGSSMNTALTNGLGIGCSVYNKNNIKMNSLIDVFPDMPDKVIPYYLTYHRRLEGSPKIKAFYDFLKKEVVDAWQ